jgi:hypothetical protein
MTEDGEVAKGQIEILHWLWHSFETFVLQSVGDQM